MPDIRMEVPLNAAPDKLYQALTRQDEIRSWWTQQADAQPKVGTVSEFRFYNGGVTLRLEVEKLEPNQVVWKAVSGVPDWPGTRVVWDIVPGENGGSKLLFSHRDFASSEGSLPYTTYNWAWYIISLKKYLETGAGSPHTGDPNS